MSDDVTVLVWDKKERSWVDAPAPDQHRADGWGRIDRQHRPREAVTLEPPTAGDPCPDPHCREGRFELRTLPRSDPGRPGRMVLMCLACGVEARRG